MPRDQYGMTDEERKLYEDRNHQINNGHEFQLNQSAYVGAMIRYCWYFGKRKMSELNHPKQRLKNAYTANILTIVVVIGFIFTAYYFFS